MALTEVGFIIDSWAIEPVVPVSLTFDNLPRRIRQTRLRRRSTAGGIGDTAQSNGQTLRPTSTVRRFEQGRDRRRLTMDRILDEALEGLDFRCHTGDDEVWEQEEESEPEVIEYLPVWVGAQPNSLMGTYDPFDANFPRNHHEIDWGFRAAAWIIYELATEEARDIKVGLICEPFDWDGYAIRTQAWFYALEFDQQVEVLLQRYFEKRPGSKWIIGPHDELLPEWEWRITNGQCRILDIEYPGCEGGFLLAHQMDPGYDVLMMHTEATLFDQNEDPEDEYDEEAYR